MVLKLKAIDRLEWRIGIINLWAENKNNNNKPTPWNSKSGIRQ